MTAFRAAPYLCICTPCLNVAYGSCSLFKNYEMVVGELNQIALRGGAEEATSEAESEVVLDFAQVNSIVAIPESNEKSTNTISFVKIIAHCSNQNKEDIVDDYLEVRHLCKSIDHSKGTLYIVDNRQMFVFKKRVLYTLLYRQRGTKAKTKSTTLKTKNSP